MWFGVVAVNTTERWIVLTLPVAGLSTTLGKIVVAVTGLKPVVCPVMVWATGSTVILVRRYPLSPGEVVERKVSRYRPRRYHGRIVLHRDRYRHRECSPLGTEDVGGSAIPQSVVGRAGIVAAGATVMATGVVTAPAGTTMVTFPPAAVTVPPLVVTWPPSATVITAVPVLVSLVAVIVADPTLRPR